MEVLLDYSRGVDVALPFVKQYSVMSLAVVGMEKPGKVRPH
jgi:hypothetical protein